MSKINLKVGEEKKEGIAKLIARIGLDNCKEVAIPEGAKYIRLKSNFVLFFDSYLNKSIKIPENAKKLSLPSYYRNAYHIDYGTIKFE